MMKRSGILFLGIMVSLVVGCGEERGTSARGQTGQSPTSSSPGKPGVKEASAEAQWQNVERGSSRFVARLVELEDATLSAITQKADGFVLEENCIQVIRPLQTDGDIVGSVEFLPEACPKGPIVVGDKAPAFILTIRRGADSDGPAQAEESADGAEESETRTAPPLKGGYDLFFSDEQAGNVRVGAIQFQGDRATISELCAGDPEAAVCRVEVRESRFHSLVINHETLKRAEEKQKESELSAHERARRAVEEARASLAEAEQRLSDVNELITVAENEAQEELSASQEQLAQLREELTVQTEQVAAAREDVRRLQEENRKLTTTMEERETRVTENEQMLKDALAALERADQQLQTAQKQVNQAQIEIKATEDVLNEPASAVETETKVTEEELNEPASAVETEIKAAGDELNEAASAVEAEIKAVDDELKELTPAAQEVDGEEDGGQSDGHPAPPQL